MEANTPPDSARKTDRDDLDLTAEQVVMAYHERTKHHYHRYAASLGYLDWAKRLRLTVPALCILANSLETVRENHMVSAFQSIEREPTPDGGIRWDGQETEREFQRLIAENVKAGQSVDSCRHK
jgi:hypothetical protein